ncbi:MAG: MFS transporter [Candidatus Rokuibacteriota bacterium]|nr:MAG: MFS transporter [Candidatus Rokubacteria bacterium]
MSDAPAGRAVGAVFVAKGARTFCYGYLGILLPLYLADLGLSAAGVGASVTLTLVGSAALTWAVRAPAERYGARAALSGLAALSLVAATLLLAARAPWVVVLAAMLGNVAVGAGETGPFLSIEQVVIARATDPARRTTILSLYNLLGYGAAALGAGAVALGAPRTLFAGFLAAALVQLVAYAGLGRVGIVRTGGGAPVRSTPRIRRLAALFSIDSFAGGFVLQSLIAYFLHERFDLGLDALGRVFLVAQLLTAASLLLAPRLARRFGLLPTMVVTHLISNVLLIAIAAAPAAWVAVSLLFGRQLLSQIDVPTRQAYVMAVVDDREREAAATTTTLWRTSAQAVTPLLTGWIMQTVALSAPFVLGGALKIVYDVLLYLTFKDVKPREV